jgi:hypothetical protein
VNEFKTIFDRSYAAGVAAFVAYRGLSEVQHVSPIRFRSELRDDAQQRLANAGHDLDMFARLLSDQAFTCGWSDAEQDE